MGKVNKKDFLLQYNETIKNLNFIQRSEISLSGLPDYTKDMVDELNETVPLGTQENLRSRLISGLIELNKFCNHKFNEFDERRQEISEEEMDNYKYAIVERLYRSGVPYEYSYLAMDSKDLNFITIINSDIYKQSQMADKTNGLIAEEYYKYQSCFDEKNRESVLLAAQRNIPLSLKQIEQIENEMKADGVDLDKFHNQLNKKVDSIKKVNFGTLSLREFEDNFKKEYNKIGKIEKIPFKNREKLNSRELEIYDRCFDAYEKGKLNKVSEVDREVFNLINEKHFGTDRVKQVNKENKMSLYSQLKTLVENQPKPKFWQIGNRFRLWKCNNLLKNMEKDMLKEGITKSELEDFCKTPYNPDHFDKEDQNKLDYENYIYEQQMNKEKGIEKEQEVVYDEASLGVDLTIGLVEIPQNDFLPEFTIDDVYKQQIERLKNDKVVNENPKNEFEDIKPVNQEEQLKAMKESIVIPVEQLESKQGVELINVSDEVQKVNEITEEKVA